MRSVGRDRAPLPRPLARRTRIVLRPYYGNMKDAEIRQLMTLRAAAWREVGCRGVSAA
jgi:hypothetical protein